MKILVVDDEPAICDLLNEYLSLIGYEVSTAIDGKDAILKFKKNSPEVVILDIRMPGENGIDVLRRIREMDEDVKVIMLSAFCDPDTIQEALQIGARCYLEKPIELEFLGRTLIELQKKK